MKVTQTRVPRSLRVFYMTELQQAFINLDADIQQVKDPVLSQKLIYGMIDLLLILNKDELRDYANGCSQKEAGKED